VSDEEDESEGPIDHRRGWALSIALLAATLVSTLYVGAVMHGVDVVDLRTLWSGADFALPLLAILVTHELGHYVAGRLHGVDISPPYFIPMPITLFGTMGAVIRQRGRIASNDALLDVGASGPLAGMCVALPVLVYGVATSSIVPVPSIGDDAILEGHSILYEIVLRAVHGTIPAGMDIFLTPTAFAGWAGLLVTMINLVPVGQLDGGHVAFALFGERQNRYSRFVLAALPVTSLLAGAWYGAHAWLAGLRGEHLTNALRAGEHWMVWFVVLLLLGRMSGFEHPPAGNTPLSPGRRAVAIGTLLLFVLLFMPAAIREP
jgi:membrane-associated protease RseP (regulator of RpoE activity)